ncbi:MAG: hypothetical protein ACK6CU_12720, partial [Deltaproteobacteria bacterium]
FEVLFVAGGEGEVQAAFSCEVRGSAGLLSVVVALVCQGFEAGAGLGRTVSMGEAEPESASA